jgi:hypothetical protein
MKFLWLFVALFLFSFPVVYADCKDSRVLGLNVNVDDYKKRTNEAKLTDIHAVLTSKDSHKVNPTPYFTNDLQGEEKKFESDHHELSVTLINLANFGADPELIENQNLQTSEKCHDTKNINIILNYVARQGIHYKSPSGYLFNALNDFITRSTLFNHQNTSALSNNSNPIRHKLLDENVFFPCRPLRHWNDSCRLKISFQDR